MAPSRRDHAATDQVPMILMSGRTPVMEKDRFGARTVPIGWGQEMRDQTSLVREASKWDYELRFPEQVSEILDRALAITKFAPQGPGLSQPPARRCCARTCPPEGMGRPAPDAAQCRRAGFGQHRTRRAAGCRKRRRR